MECAFSRRARPVLFRLLLGAKLTHLQSLPFLHLRGCQRNHLPNLGLSQEGQDCGGCFPVLGEQSDGGDPRVFPPASLPRASPDAPLI